MAGPWRVRSPADLGPAPIRLTHRGRVVVAALAVLGVVAVITLVWIGAAGGVSAASHQPASGAAAGYRGLTEVTVQPGQTLWGIAQRAEPSADPRAVIQQILQFNSMSSPVVQPGQQIWVPKG
jgi:hypothetical protein